jgi:RNA polymerase sigma factor (sigma-70 family)
MAIANRPYGKVSKGHRLPYGTLADASYELRQAYYANGYLHDKDIPELPRPPVDYVEWVDPEEELHKKEMVAVVQEMLDTVTRRERSVLCMRFGIGLTQDYSLEEVGIRFDVTRERIRQIEAKAMRKMHHPDRMDVFRLLLGEYQTTEDKKIELQKARTRWAKEREAAQTNAVPMSKKKLDLWIEIKPIIADVDWVAHMKAEKPDMYQALYALTETIWGKDTRQIWNMFAKETT